MMRSPLGESAEHSRCAGRDADVGAARNQCLLGLGGALGVGDIEREAMFFEDAAALAQLRDRSIPQAALADRKPEGIVRRCRVDRAERHGEER